MHTIQLKVNDKVYDKLLWLLSKFNKEEVEIITENQDFLLTKNYLQEELDDIISGKAKFISQSELEAKLDQIV